MGLVSVHGMKLEGRKSIIILEKVLYAVGSDLGIKYEGEGEILY